MNHVDRTIAENNTILRCLIGSQAYGLALSGNSDRDEKGVCIEPLEASMGFHEFEQYEFRTATERTGQKDAKSQDGDLDLTIYSLKKFLRLALKGNPDVTELLFLKDYLTITPLGEELQSLAPLIISRQGGRRFLGYMESQRQRMLGEIGQKKVNRPDLEYKFGYDTKYASHVIRLGFQAVELLSTGKLTFPLEGEALEFSKGVKSGQLELNEVLNRAGMLEREAKDLLTTSPLPEHPSETLVEGWMLNTYWNHWKAQRANLELLEENKSIH